MVLGVGKDAVAVVPLNIDHEFPLWFAKEQVFAEESLYELERAYTGGDQAEIDAAWRGASRWHEPDHRANTMPARMVPTCLLRHHRKTQQA